MSLYRWIWFCLFLGQAFCGKFIPSSSLDSELQKRIQRFKSVLEQPDDFTPGELPDTLNDGHSHHNHNIPTERRYGVASLQEVEEGDDLMNAVTEDPGDFQGDIQRFLPKSGISPRGDTGADYRKKMRKKRRMEQEWKKFLKWRKKQKQKKKLRKRIMKAITKKLELKFRTKLQGQSQKDDMIEGLKLQGEANRLTDKKMRRRHKKRKQRKERKG